MSDLFCIDSMFEGPTSNLQNDSISIDSPDILYTKPKNIGRRTSKDSKAGDPISKGTKRTTKKKQLLTDKIKDLEKSIIDYNDDGDIEKVEFIGDCIENTARTSRRIIKTTEPITDDVIILDDEIPQAQTSWGQRSNSSHSTTVSINSSIECEQKDDEIISESLATGYPLGARRSRARNRGRNSSRYNRANNMNSYQSATLETQTQRSRRGRAINRGGSGSRSARSREHGNTNRSNYASAPNVIVFDEDIEGSYTPLFSNAPKTKPTERIESDNSDIEIKVLFKGVLENQTLKRYQPFKELFQRYADRVGVDICKISIHLNSIIGRKILMNEMPDDIKVNVATHFYVDVFKDALSFDVDDVSDEENKITIKVQTNQRRQIKDFKIGRTQTFMALLVKCSTVFDIPCDKLKLKFDGDYVQLNDTPNDLDLDGGEVFDLITSP